MYKAAEVLKYLLARCTKQGEHLLWTQGCKETTGKPNPVTPAVICFKGKVPPENKRRESPPHIWLDMCRRKDFTPIDKKRAKYFKLPTCDKKNCIAHWELRTINIEKVEQMTDADIKAARFRFTQYCAAKDPVTNCIS
jgi:hypothetical protein